MSIELEIVELPNVEVIEIDLNKIIEEKEKEDGFDFYKYFDNILNGYLFIIISLSIFLSFVSLIIISVVLDGEEINGENSSAEDDLTFWGNLFLKYFVIIVMQFFTSYLVRYKNLKVNYSRKIMHFSFFLWPQLLDNLLLTFKSNIITQFWNIWIVLFTIFLLTKKIRDNFYPCEFTFSAIDRPEDRPFTLQWTVFQVLLIFIVLIPFSILFIRSNTIPSEWVFIPILINGFSDGLAEPIGIRFGKHKYKTIACCTKKRYTRSFEGSTWVYICTLAIIAIFHETFTHNQLIISLTCYPVMITLVEAMSPHTIDAPFLYLFGYSSLYAMDFINT